MKALKKIKRIALRYFKKIKKLVYNDKNIYLIYTMGKVGSASIYNALKKKKPHSHIFHVHFLSKNWLETILPKTNEVFHSNIKMGTHILNFIKKNPTKRIKVITLVREPVMRAISDLFQNWDHLFDDIENVEYDKLLKHIEEIDFDYTLNWFDTEFFEYLDVDIYKLHFDKTKGYEIYNYKNLDILCIKLEALNKIGDDALKEFTGKKINLVSSNKSSDKKGKDQYNFLKNNVKMNKDMLIDLFHSKYVRHFYNEKEITDFINKWSQN